MLGGGEGESERCWEQELRESVCQCGADGKRFTCSCFIRLKRQNLMEKRQKGEGELNTDIAGLLAGATLSSRSSLRQIHPTPSTS